MAKRPQFNGVYDMMDFPPYEFKEYPKVVTLAGGTTVTVGSQREELDALTNDQTENPTAPHPAELEAARISGEKDELQKQLDEMKAKMDAMMAKLDGAPQTGEAEKTPASKSAPSLTTGPTPPIAPILPPAAPPVPPTK